MYMRIRHSRTSNHRAASLWKPAFALLALACAAGCAGTSGSTSSTAWASGAPRGTTYSRVLVVGVSASEDNRCMFENFLADQLTSPSTQVIQSCNQATPVTPPTRESVARMVAATGADAVLATRFVGAQAAVQNDGSRDDRGGYYFKDEGTTDAISPWGFYDLPVVYGQYENQPSLSLLEGKLTVSSKFYSTQKAMLVCTIATTVKDNDTSDNAIASIAEAIADRLRRDGLVK
jgi:hypothetical protein